jgi:hypothetical protein
MTTNNTKKYYRNSMYFQDELKIKQIEDDFFNNQLTPKQISENYKINYHFWREGKCWHILCLKLPLTSVLSKVLLYLTN